MSLVNCEINIIPPWSGKCVVSEGDRATTFTITNTSFYVLAVTLLTQDNTKLLEQLKLGFSRTNNWSKCQSKMSTKLIFWLFDPSFQGISRLFILSFENNAHRKRDARYFLPKVEIKKDYNAMTDGQNFLVRLVKEMITRLVVY